MPYVESSGQNRSKSDKDGMISVPEVPGVGVAFSTEAISKYLVDVEIVVSKKVLYRTPTV